MRRIAFVCEKGGTGKTTTATCVAVGLAKQSKRVLLIDADQQANATWTLLGGQGADAPTLAAVLTRQALASEAIRPTQTPGLNLLPAETSLGGVNVGLAQEVGRDTRLRSALSGLPDDYDFVLFDSGPQFTTVLANVLVATNEVIVPLDAGVYAMLGVVQLNETLAEVREAYGNEGLHLAGLVLTKMQRNNVARDVESELRSRFGDKVFKSTIPLSTKIEEAHTRGQTVMEFAPKSAGAIAYANLIEEIVSHGRAKERGRGKAIRGSGTTYAA